MAIDFVIMITFPFINNDTNVEFRNLKLNAYSPVHGEVHSIQHYVIKFVSDLRQVGGFLRVLRFLPPIKLTATI